MNKGDAQWSKIAWVKKHHVNQAQENLLAAKQHLHQTLAALARVDKQIKNLEEARVETNNTPWQQDMVDVQALVAAQAHIYYLKEELTSALEQREKKAREITLAEKYCEQQRLQLIKAQTHLDIVEKKKKSMIANNLRLQENTENEKITEQWSLSTRGRL